MQTCFIDLEVLDLPVCKLFLRLFSQEPMRRVCKVLRRTTNSIIRLGHGRYGNFLQALILRTHLPKFCALHFRIQNRVVFFSRIRTSSLVARHPSTLRHVSKIKALTKIVNVLFAGNDTLAALIVPLRFSCFYLRQLLELVNVV